MARQRSSQEGTRTQNAIRDSLVPGSTRLVRAEKRFPVELDGNSPVKQLSVGK